MKKLISALSLLICTLMVFSSCSGVGRIKIDEKKLSESLLPKTITSSELTSVDGGFVYDSSGKNLAMFKNSTKNPDSTSFKIINLSNGTVVLEKLFSNSYLSEGNGYVAFPSNGADFIIVYENKTYTVLKADGTTLSTSTTEPQFVNDNILIGENLYRYDLDTYEIKETFKYSLLNGAIPQCNLNSYKYSDFYIKTFENSFAVYDKEYNYIGNYFIPGYAVDADIFILNEGKVFVQYLIALPDDESQYDLIFENEKFNIVQKIINPKNLSEKNLDLDFVVADTEIAIGNKSINLFKSDIHNIASIYEIENKKYDTKNKKTVSLENDGKIKELFDEKYLTVSILGSGYLAGISKDLNLTIIDKNQNIICGANGIIDATEKYIVTDSAIYAFASDGKSAPSKIQDLKTDSVEYQYVSNTGNNLILSAEDENGNLDYYLFDGTFTIIADYSANQSFVEKLDITGVYAVENISEGQTTTTVYKSDKTALATYNGVINIEYKYGNDNKTITLISADSKYFTIISSM